MFLYSRFSLHRLWVFALSHFTLETSAGNAVQNVKSPSEGLSTYKGCSFVDLLARSSFRAAFYFNSEFVQSTLFANYNTFHFFSTSTVSKHF